MAEKEVIIEHLGTEEMFANVLTKPVQGEQFQLGRIVSLQYKGCVSFNHLFELLIGSYMLYW